VATAIAWSLLFALAVAARQPDSGTVTLRGLQVVNEDGELAVSTTESEDGGFQCLLRPPGQRDSFVLLMSIPQSAGFYVGGVRGDINVGSGNDACTLVVTDRTADYRVMALFEQRTDKAGVHVVDAAGTVTLTVER
jgi:hypothetical protein